MLLCHPFGKTFVNVRVIIFKTSKLHEGSVHQRYIQTDRELPQHKRTSRGKTSLHTSNTFTDVEDHFGVNYAARNVSSEGLLF